MQVGKCERAGIEKKSFPRAGINHPVAHLQSYHVMTVTDQEFDMILLFRKRVAELVRVFHETD